jgi:transcriptional regulator with XRE-family HTH domain
MNIGETLNEARKDCKYSKTELAKRVKFSYEGIRLILLNKRVPTPETLEKLIKVLKIPETAAVELREECIAARILRRGFDAEKIKKESWEYFVQFLRDEPEFEDADFNYIKKCFDEALDRHLILDKRL